MKHDLNQNDDWWFCEDDEGNQGFVPTNYLRPMDG